METMPCHLPSEIKIFTFSPSTAQAHAKTAFTLPGDNGSDLSTTLALSMYVLKTEKSVTLNGRHHGLNLGGITFGWTKKLSSHFQSTA